MNRSLLIRALLGVTVAAGLTACAEPAHLSYDFGRAYSGAFDAQPDLTRATANNLDHPLSGVEAQAIRINVQAETTEAKAGESIYVIGD